MKLKGRYSAETSYSVGDAVLFENGVFYHLQQAAPAGTSPVDTRYWGQVSQPTSEAYRSMIDLMDSTADVASSVETVAASVPTNISDSAIVLKSTAEGSDDEYLITVDDSGDTPELDVTLIEEEVAAEGGDS